MTRVKTALILLCSVILVSPFAFAADPGTYRPGQAYAATQAISHNACESQCKGDAACRGWNFVKVNPRQTHGICEFNSRAVDPIPSPIGISANHEPIVNFAGHSQIVSAGVRTTRIGSPTAPQPIQQVIKRPAAKPAISTQASINRPSSTKPASAQNLTIAEQLSQPPSRNVIRKPIPEQNPVRPAAFKHDLGSPVQQQLRPNAVRTQPPQNLTIAEQLSQPPSRQIIRNPVPEQKAVKPAAYKHDLGSPAQQQPRPNVIRTQNGLPPRAPQYQQGLNNAPSALPPSPPITASANNTPRPQRGGLIRALTQGHQNNGGLAPQSAPKAPVIGAPQESLEVATHKSLYGHLNDDVNIPKPLTPEDLNTPVNEPIPTATSVPVIPVDREEFSGLLGR